MSRFPPGIRRSHWGICHTKDCPAPVSERSPCFCPKHLAAREIYAREHPAEVLILADYSRDDVTGYLHKKIS